MSGKDTNFRLRLLSALILIPPILYALWQGGIVFLALITLVSAIALWEWQNIIASQKPVFKLASLISAMALMALLSVSYGGFAFSDTLLHSWLIFTFILAVVAFSLLVDWVLRRHIFPWSLVGFTLIYATAIAFIELRALKPAPNGLFIIFYLFIIIWTNDIAAYLVGRKLGGAKLWVRISPGKTWSGAFGGLVFGTLAGTVTGIYFAPVTLNFQPLFWLGIAIIFSITGQLGDLAESALKRRFQVKDSGAIIPGHGGMLDRIDSLIPVTIMAAIIFS